MENKKKIFIGGDDGFRMTKLFTSDGRSIIINSQAKSGEQNQISVGGGAQTVFEYSANGKPYIVGDISDCDSTSFDDYPYSDMNRVLVTHALKMLGLDGYEVTLITGLPIKKFYKGKKLNQENIKNKMKNLLLNDVKSVSYTKSGKEKSNFNIPVIVRHKVMSEGVAAWMDYVIERNEDGKLTQNVDKFNEKIAIIDIGGKTTDIAVIKGGNLDFDRSTTIDHGMLNIESNVRESISEEYDFEPDVEQMNKLMSSGFVEAWGERIDVSGIIEDEKEKEAESIKSEIKSQLKKAADIKKIIFVGGTSSSLKKFLVGIYKHQEFANEPEFANARGMAKFAELMGQDT